MLQPFFCELCQIGCTSQDILNVHMQGVHFSMSGKKHLKNLRRGGLPLQTTTAAPTIITHTNAPAMAPPPPLSKKMVAKPGFSATHENASIFSVAGGVYFLPHPRSNKPLLCVVVFVLFTFQNPTLIRSMCWNFMQLLVLHSTGYVAEYIYTTTMVAPYCTTGRTSMCVLCR